MAYLRIVGLLLVNDAGLEIGPSGVAIDDLGFADVLHEVADEGFEHAVDDLADASDGQKFAQDIVAQ